jgi:hypothetical protein
MKNGGVYEGEWKNGMRVKNLKKKKKMNRKNLIYKKKAKSI